MEIVFKIIVALSSIYGIYKGRQEILLKRTSNDFEQIYKYFSASKIKEMSKEPPYIRDMACKTVSFLKQFKFYEIYFILKNNKIDFLDLSNILWLIKIKILEINNNRLAINNKSAYYPLFVNNNTNSTLKEKLKICFIEFRTGKFFIMLLWIAYIFSAFFILFSFLKENFLLAIIYTAVFQFFIQVPLMLYEEKIKSIKKYIEKGNDGNRKIDELLNKVNTRIYCSS
ncbi:hypothetical protein [Kingella oralis]|uniref:hypothetical protein n=1 Tax=Kingella oralis TaxID=505 RepID=UPI0034E4F294